jgi:hypothetical protein
MDNVEQIREIINYKKYLQNSFGITLDEETVARLWILKYASIWRTIRAGKGNNKEKVHEKMLDFYESGNSSVPYLLSIQQ